MHPNDISTDGVANILIWGYAEPALGMIVGNIATLRPLFRRALKLDGSAPSGPSGPPDSAPGISNKSGQSHPYKSFDQDHDHELGNVLGGGRTNDIVGGRHVPGGGRDSLTGSDNDSQKEILGGGSKDRGIMVSKHVEVSRS